MSTYFGNMSEVCSSLSICELDLTWTDPYRTLDDSPFFKVGIGLAIMVLLSVGTCFTLGIALFEKWGGDPQKRGLSNQLLYSTCLITIAYNWITLPVDLYATMFESIHNSYIFWIWCFLHSFYFFWMLLGTVIHVTIQVKM